MKFENYMILEFPSKSANEAFARSAVACFASQLDPTIEELGEALLQMILRVASGEPVKHELFGIGEIAMPRLCNYC